MLSLSMWDCDFFHNKIILINNVNPYNNQVLEFWLVQYVLNNVENINKSSEFRDHEKVIHYLAENKVEYYLDPWMAWKLFHYAIYLCRQANLIKLTNKTDSALNKKKKFAVFLEAGMLDPLNEINITKALSEMGNEDKRNHLWHVLYMNHELKKVFDLPTIHFNYKELNKEYTIKYQNFRKDFFTTINEVPIMFPLSSWSHPTLDEETLGINSRGLIHHIGDEIAFIIAAKQYGDCYIVGKDEIGDLVILSDLNNPYDANYAQYKRVSCMDFDYIYGVPKGRELKLTQATYITAEPADCKINDQKNSFLTDNYWNNEVFKSLAGRQFNLLSLQEMIEQIFTKQTNICREQNFNIDKYLTKLIKLLNKIAAIVFEVEQIEPFFKIIKKEDVCLEIEKTLGLIDAKNNMDYFFHSFEFQTRLREYLNSDVINKVKILSDLLDKNKLLNSNKKLANNSLKKEENQFKQFKKLIMRLNTACKEYSKQLEQIKIIDKSIIEGNSFFYKTLAHKAHCEIINPTMQTQLGFFLKNDGQEPEKTYLSLVDFLNYEYIEILNSIAINNINENKKDNIKTYLDQNNLTDKNNYIKKYIKCRIMQNVPQHSKILYDYWDKINCKAFLVSEVVDMKNEYRMFVINNRVVATSPCFRNTTPFNAWENGRFDPRLCHGHSANDTIENQQTRDRVALYAKFARKFNSLMKKIHPEVKNYVLDVAWSEQKNQVIPIELNSITWSGAYQINMLRLCAAIAGQSYQYNFSKTPLSYEYLKDIAWQEMKKANIITENQHYSDNGAQRTIRAYEKMKSEENNFNIPNLYDYENMSNMSEIKDIIKQIQSDLDSPKGNEDTEGKR